MPPEDPRAEPPEPKQTVALKKDDIVQAQLKQVLDAVASFRAEVNSGLTHLTADVQLVSNDLGIVKDRVAIIEGWKNDQDARAARNSKRVQQVSESDLAQQAQIADVITWRKGVDEKLSAVPTKADLESTTLAQTTALLARFDELKKKPVVRYALAVAGTAITTWLASKGHL